MLVSLYFALKPGDDETTPTTTVAQTTTAAATTETTTTAATTTAPAEPAVVRITVSVPGDKAPTVQHFTVKQGRQVVFIVKSELADEVHLHGYDLMGDVAPGEPATIAFKANAPGLFETELESRSSRSPSSRFAPDAVGPWDRRGERPARPDWLFFWGGAVVLVLSFLALGALWKSPQLERRRAGQPLPPGLERFLRSRVLRGLLGVVSAGLLILIFLTALIGEPSSAQNLAPTFIYVIFWLGLVPVQLRVRECLARPQPVARVRERRRLDLAGSGRTWTAAAGLSATARASGRRLPAPLLRGARARPTPIRPARGRWRSRSRSTATSLWFGMAAYGRQEWVRTGTASPSTSACSRGSRLSGSTRAGSSCGYRSPASRAEIRRPGPAGLRRRDARIGRLRRASAAHRSGRTCAHDLEGPYIVDHRARAELISTALSIAGLIGCMLLVALAYLGAIRIARRMIVDSDRPLAPEFVSEPRADRAGLRRRALLHAARDPGAVRARRSPPIPSASAGTSRHPGLRAEHRAFRPNTVWYVQVGALVAGHVAGLTVAHDRAVTILRERDALRSQYAMLASDGRLHRRRVVAALPGRLVAHGGTGGAIGEALLVVSDRRDLLRRLAARAARDARATTKTTGLDQAAVAGGVRPRVEAAPAPVRALGDPHLLDRRPVVRCALAAQELGAVLALEADVHLQAAVVAVAGVRPPALARGCARSGGCRARRRGAAGAPPGTRPCAPARQRSRTHRR